MLKLGGLNVYGVWYDIFEASNDEIKEALSGDERFVYFGCNLSMKQEIYINEDAKPENKKRTLIHELTHAILFVLGYGRKHDEESRCTFISAHYEFIKNSVEIFYNKGESE